MFLHRVLDPHLVAFAEQAARRRWPSQLRSSATFVLIACLVGLSCLAHASPPDPVWLPGMYDGADYDDELALLTDTPVADTSRPLAAGPPCPGRRLMPVGSASARADRSLLGFYLRSPPIT